ncbi:MAG: PQQ-dependent sugar dehydrogenase [Vicinamibacterales bacterium]
MKRGFVLGLAIGLPAVAAIAAPVARDLPSGTETPALTIEIADYLALPITGKLDGTGQTDGMLARVNSLREEPGATNRLFVNDLNGPLYILDKKAKTLTTYLDFNGRDGRPGIFHRLSYETGFANGLENFQFDPDYQRNGKFYTVHIEDQSLPDSNLPDNAHFKGLTVSGYFKGLTVSGYATTAPIVPPGPTAREAILIEWTDSNIANATFEGSARELLRVQFNTRIHLIADLTFNPAAQRGSGDWRVLYLGCGDGGAGESSRPDTRSNPQRLDTLVGKILRIVPDLAEQPTTSSVSDNGRYRIPNDNPFVTTSGARKEIWAYGFRNPHRLHWAIDAAEPRRTRLVANSIGLRTWETINIVHRGANYGYSLREGNELLQFDNFTATRPEIDRIPVQIGDLASDATIQPTYPVIQYGHVQGGGDAIGSGYLYRGKAVPALRGKYVFTDLSTGRLWYADYADMLAADDGDATTMASMHEIHVLWNDPNDMPDAGKKVYPTLFPIVEAGYHLRGGKDANLPGRARVSGEGRADAQFAVDAAGELYIFSKSDGMIRAVVGAVGGGPFRLPISAWHP